MTGGDRLADKNPALQRLERLTRTSPALFPFLVRDVPGLSQWTDSPESARGWTLRTATWALDPSFDLAAEYSASLRRALSASKEGGTLIAVGRFAADEALPLCPAEIAVASAGGGWDELPSALASEGVRSLTRVEAGGGGLTAWLAGPPPMPGPETEERLCLALARSAVLAGKPVDLGPYLAPSTRPLDDWLHLKRHQDASLAVQYRRRHVNLHELDWLIDLALLRSPVIARPLRTPDRLLALRDAGFLSPIEREALEDAWRFLTETQARLALLGCPDDVVPENPDKLARLAESFGMTEGNGFLAAFEGYRDVTHSIFQEGIQRLH